MENFIYARSLNELVGYCKAWWTRQSHFALDQELLRILLRRRAWLLRIPRRPIG